MTALRTVIRSSPIRALGIGVLVSLAIIGCRQFGLLEAFELAAYDWIIRSAPTSHEANDRIVLVTITEDDLQRLQQWPISDAQISAGLRILTEYGARTIGLDLYRDKIVEPGRDELNALLTEHPEIVTVMKFRDEHGTEVSGPPILEGTDQIGFNDILVDPGGIVRRGFLFLEDQQGTATSFSLLLALKYLEKEGILPYPDPIQPALMRIGKMTVPRFQPNDGGYVERDAKGYQFLIKFSGTRQLFTRYAFTSLLSGEANPEAIRDKVVIIGTAADSVRDDFYTPFSQGRDRDQQIPGMELHAHLANQFLRMALEYEAPMRSLGQELESGWIIIWGALGAILTLKFFSPWRLTLLLGGGAGALIFIAYWAFQMSWWIPLVPPVITWLIAGSLATAWISKKDRQEHTMLMQLFSQHVSPEVAKTIWDQREQFLQDGRIRPQKLTATVLFADLEGFTAVAEQKSPQALMEWLNTYLMSMANVIAAHGGVVDDFFGDGVKANFGIPVARTKQEDIQHDAIKAVECGLTLIHEISKLMLKPESMAVSERMIRIGIATGPVVVGSVGSQRRLKYTTVGDVVNIAARLEQLGKNSTGVRRGHDAGSLLITQETKNYLDTRWDIQEVGPVSLPGKQDPICVYRVLSGPPERISSFVNRIS